MGSPVAGWTCCGRGCGQATSSWTTGSLHVWRSWRRACCTPAPPWKPPRAARPATQWACPPRRAPDPRKYRPSWVAPHPGNRDHPRSHSPQFGPLENDSLIGNYSSWVVRAQTCTGNALGDGYCIGSALKSSLQDQSLHSSHRTLSVGSHLSRDSSVWGLGRMSVKARRPLVGRLALHGTVARSFTAHAAVLMSVFVAPPSIGYCLSKSLSLCFFGAMQSTVSGSSPVTAVRGRRSLTAAASSSVELSVCWDLQQVTPRPTTRLPHIIHIDMIVSFRPWSRIDFCGFV